MDAQFDPIQSIKSIESNYGPQVAREVVQIFVTDYPGKIAKLREAIDKKNFESIRFLAHDIKSGCLSMGIKPMSALCEKIEHDGSKLSQDQLTEMVVELEEEYMRTSRDYNDYLNKPQTH